jgi:uncharacterized protein YigA (DUF484 family)
VRPIAANVVDFGPAALARLEKAYTQESEARQEMETVARANYDAQVQTHAAVLELLEARNNADLAHRFEAAAHSRFGLSAAALLVEGPAPSGWRSLRPGEADDLIGGRSRRLGPAEAVERLFGASAGGVGSMALVRLELWRIDHPGLLALGAAREEVFSREMGADLVEFLARVIERMADRWPPLL